MTLLRREASDLRKFRLFSGPKYEMFKSSWILYALKHNPEVLNVDYMREGSLPLDVFTCASLVDVSLLHGVKSVHNIKVINLPCLRRLHLIDTTLNQDFVDKIFCGCPELEFLHLKDCCRDYSVINSQRLKYLKLEDCDDSGSETENKMELINTPNVWKFCYTNREFFGHKMLLTMPSLTSANVILSNSYNPFSYTGKSNILIGLSDVKNLQLSGYTIKEEVHGNEESLKIAPFKGKRLETVEVKFNRYDENFPRVMKYLQDITEKSSVRISMTSLY